MNHSSNRRLKLVIPLAALALLATACGGGGEETSDGVATLETSEQTDEQALGAAGTETGGGSSTDGGEDSGDAEPGTAEEAALQFAECMRGEGLDFPDPTVDADGNPSFDGAIRAGADGGLDLRSEEGQAALNTCRDLTEGFTFGRGGGDGFDRTAFQDALLPYTECLRDEGLDVGDVTLGGTPGAGAGNGQATDGDTQGRGRQAGGPGGDPSDRIAGFLGLDSEDPETEAALETCSPLLDEALAGFGPGSGGNDQ